MKKKIAALNPHEIASKLYKLREEIAAFDDSIKPLKEKEETLRTDMLTALKEQRLDSFRDENVPLTFTRAYRSSLEITDAFHAMDWAITNECAKVDTIAANKKLKGVGALPKGFDYKETEYLTVKTISDDTL